MAGDNYPGSNTQLEMSPAQDVSCAEHLDSPGDVQQTGTAYAESPGEAVIASSMSSPTEPHSTAITKSNSTSLVLTKESVSHVLPLHLQQASPKMMRPKL